MKKIEFGFSNDKSPTGSWQGIGIKEGLMLTEAMYYGAVQYDGNNYIIAKVVEDTYNRFPNLKGNFIVRQALCDIYADGSSVLMLNQDESIVTKKMEEYLNSNQVKDKINGYDDIIKLVSGIHRAPNSFLLAELDSTIIATSILPEVFEEKNYNIKNCHSPISELQGSLSRNYTK